MHRATGVGVVVGLVWAVGLGARAGQRSAQGGGADQTRNACVAVISDALTDDAGEQGVSGEAMAIDDRSEGNALHVVLTYTGGDTRIPYSAVHIAPAPGSDAGWRTRTGLPDAFEALKPAAASDTSWPDSYRMRSEGSKVATVVGTNPGSEAGRAVERAVDECFRQMRVR